MYPLTYKLPIDEAVEPAGALPGHVYYSWGGLDMAVLTAYNNDGVPALDVVNVRLNEPLDDGTKTIGRGELVLGDQLFLAAINK